MKLITHNMLTSNIIKGVTKGFPLNVLATMVEMQTFDFNPAFIIKSLSRIDYPALKQAATQVGHGEDLPDNLEEGFEEKEDILKRIHHVLLEVEVLEGALECPETGRKFPITNGCPNMLLSEHEISRRVEDVTVGMQDFGTFANTGGRTAGTKDRPGIRSVGKLFDQCSAQTPMFLVMSSTDNLANKQPMLSAYCIYRKSED